LIDELAQQYAGSVKIGKVNVDENPELSAQFGVRSIPYVVAFVDGRPVDSFVGVLPESQLRAFIDRNMRPEDHNGTCPTCTAIVPITDFCGQCGDEIGDFHHCQTE
jgi:thioredoxin-like negative regulator of GroEL